jgi:heterodisulfide reductase subunit C/nitrate reductase gamma subunit
MVLAQQVLFLLVSIFAIGLFARKMSSLRRTIFLGKKEQINDRKSARWKQVVLLALGQKKLFKKPIPAIFHFFVYAGFILINIEVLEILVDGICGTERAFAPYLGSLYPLAINFFEILAVLVLVGVIAFWLRRNVMRLKRFTSPELQGDPLKDANRILYIEIVLMSMLLLMNAADPHAHFLVSQHLKGLFTGWSESNVHLFMRLTWWGHILGIFAFLNYLPYSKHLHIILAFPNAYYSRLEPQGTLSNMPEIQQEVLYMMDPSSAPASTDAAPVSFGAKDVTDLSWKHLLEAYACTECGRCTEQCPANITGKKLSPRKIMMDTRDRAEELSARMDKNGNIEADGKSLLHDYISVEELRACTTCNACVEACPVGIEPLSIIMQLRRNLIMEESNAPQEWNMMFGNIENNMAPWKLSPDDRDAWTQA